MMCFKQIPAKALRRISCEDGAVTVDWVVLAAAVIGLSIAIFTTLGNGTHDHAERIGQEFSAQGIRTAY